MLLNYYQDKAFITNIYPTNLYGTLAMVLALNEEAGEVASKFSKSIRDEKTSDLKAIAYELGDCLWQVSQIADRIGYSLQEIAEMNLAKLTKRKEENKISGSGDDR